MTAAKTDPLRNCGPLIERVYAYVAYRIGDGADAEDVTSDVFERALRYRRSYDPKKGRPLTWLLRIAARCIHDRAIASAPNAEVPDVADGSDLESDVVRRITVSKMVARLDERDRELIALRYGADLTSRQVGEILGMKTNAVEVAVHRALDRLRGYADQDAASLQLLEPSLRSSSNIF